MYSDLELILACGVTALVTNLGWLVPRWLDQRRTRRQQHCRTGGRHDGPCN